MNHSILISDPFLFQPIGEDPNPLTGYYSINKYYEDDKSYCNKFFKFSQEQFDIEWDKFSTTTTDNSSDTHLFPQPKQNIKNNYNNNSYNNSTQQQQLSISSSSVLLSPSPIEHDHSYYNHHLIYSPQQQQPSSSSTLNFFSFPDTPPSTFSDMMDFNSGSLNDTFLAEFSQDSPLNVYQGEESGPLIDNIPELNQDEFADSNFVFDEIEMFENGDFFDIQKLKLQQQQLSSVLLNNNNNNNSHQPENFPPGQNDWHSQSLAVVNSGDNNVGSNSNDGSNFTPNNNNFNNNAAPTNNNGAQHVLVPNTRKQHNRKANIQVREAPESPMYESSMNDDSSHSSICYQQDVKPKKEELDESIMRNSRGATSTGARRGRKRINTNNNTSNSRSTSTDSKNDIKKTKMYMNEGDPAARNAVLARKNREKKKEEAMKIQEENARLHQELVIKQHTVQQMAKNVADLEKQLLEMKKKNRANGGLQKVFSSAKDILESVMPPLILKYGQFELEVADWFKNVGVPGNPNDVVLNLGDKPTSSYISLNISTSEKKVKVNYNPDYMGTTEPAS